MNGCVKAKNSEETGKMQKYLKKVGIVVVEFCALSRLKTLVLSQEGVAIRAIMLTVLAIVHAKWNQTASSQTAEEKTASEDEPSQ